MKTKAQLNQEVAELTQLIDDVAAVFQNLPFYGVALLDKGNTHSAAGLCFRDRVIADVAKLSPPPNLGRAKAGHGPGRGNLDVPPAIIRAANKIMREHSKGWPEDEWFQLTPDWDLNLWMQTSTKKAAAIYPMVGGQTLTSVWRHLLT